MRRGVHAAGSQAVPFTEPAPANPCTTASRKDVVASGAVDIVGLARARPRAFTSRPLESRTKPEPFFPRFSDVPEGGITAWYTMRLTEIGADKETPVFGDLGQAIRDYEARNRSRTRIWLRHFADDVVRQT